VYAANNPLMYVDPDGEFAIGTLLGTMGMYAIAGAMDGMVKGALMNAYQQVNTSWGMKVDGNLVAQAAFNGMKSGAFSGAISGGVSYIGENVSNLAQGYGFIDNQQLYDIDMKAASLGYDVESFRQAEDWGRDWMYNNRGVGVTDAYIMEKGLHWHYFDDSGNQWGVWNSENDLFGTIRHEIYQNRAEYTKIIHHMPNEFAARRALQRTINNFPEGTRYNILNRNCRNAAGYLYREYLRSGS
jgi:hypothetical protein